MILSFLNCLAKFLAASESILPSICGAISTIVTLVPIVAKNCPISLPITPPPTMINDSGCFGKLKTSSEVITFLPL